MFKSQERKCLCGDIETVPFLFIEDVTKYKTLNLMYLNENGISS